METRRPRSHGVFNEFLCDPRVSYTVAWSQGELLYGGVLMFVYGLGAGLPLLLLGHGLERWQQWFFSPRHRLWLRQVSALLLLGVGAYLLRTA